MVISKILKSVFPTICSGFEAFAPKFQMQDHLENYFESGIYYATGNVEAYWI